MGLYRLRGSKDDFLFRTASFAYYHGISANTMTAFGLCFGIGAGAMFLFRQTPLGFILGFISVFCDVLDGTIARKFNLETLRGKVFDSTADRVSELAVVLGALGGDIIEPLGVTAIIGSTSLLIFRIMSYSRGLSTDYVLFGRTERLFFIMLGLLMPLVIASTIYFIVAGVFGFVSSLQMVASLSGQKAASG
jgi:phosphatidylglycerophosphate synthase